MFIQTMPVEDTVEYTFSYTAHLCSVCEEEMFYIVNLTDNSLVVWLCLNCDNEEEIN